MPIALIVTWMDGRQETYHCESWQVRDAAVLRITGRGPRGTEKYVLPLCNIRVFKEERA
jgi:hypothetical protein